jgi:hypothetical protein
MKTIITFLLALTTIPAFAESTPAKETKFACPLGANCRVKTCTVQQLPRGSFGPQSVREKVEPESVSYKLLPQTAKGNPAAEAQLKFKLSENAADSSSSEQKTQEFTLQKTETAEGPQLVSDVKESGSDVTFFAIKFPRTEKRKARLVMLEKNASGLNQVRELPLSCDE